MKKRIFSALLAVIVVFGMLPATMLTAHAQTLSDEFAGEADLLQSEPNGAGEPVPAADDPSQTDTGSDTAQITGVSITVDGETYTEGEVIITPEIKSIVYTVTAVADPAKGGTVTGAGEYAAGETVTLTVTPNEDYALESLTVKQGETTVELGEGNTFTMPAGDVTVTATFVSCAHTNIVYTVSADGDTATVSCDSCKKVNTITMLPPAHKTYGDDLSCEVTVWINGQEYTDMAELVTYYKLVGGKWENLEDAPIDAGTYKAVAAVDYKGEVTIYVEYAIVEAEPEPQPIPDAVFTATGFDTGTLTNVTTGMQYSLDRGEKWVDITADSAALTGLEPLSEYYDGEARIWVKTPGNGTTTLDSEIQKISVYRESVPVGVSAYDESTITGVTSDMEYRKEGDEAWTKVPAGAMSLSGLESGVYQIRTAAAGKYLASDYVEVTVGYEVYSITYELYGGTVNGDYPTEYKAGEAVALPTDVTRANYSFLGWSDSDTVFNQVTEISADATGNKTFYAWWEAATYTVTFHANDGTNNTAQVSGINGIYTLPGSPFAAQVGKIFDGWAASAEGTLITDGYIRVSENTDLYAVWADCNHSGNTNKPTMDSGSDHIFTCSVCQQVVEEDHTWSITVSEDGASVAVSCDYCEYAYTVTLVAPAHKVYGDGLTAYATAMFDDFDLGEIVGEIYYRWVENDWVQVHYNIEGQTTDFPTDAGKYRVEGDFSGDNDVITLYVEYEIAKANPAYTEPTGLTAAYGATLADVALPEGFSWQDAVTTSVGAVGNNTFKVTFTPEDTANYNTVTDIAITLTVICTHPEERVEYDDNRDGTHDGSCGICKEKLNDLAAKPHTYGETGECTLCSYACDHTGHTGSYTDYTGPETHSLTCTVCQAEVTVAHDFRYNTEKHECICGTEESFTLTFDLQGGTLNGEYTDLEEYVEDGKFVLPYATYGASVLYKNFYRENVLVKEGHHIIGFEDADGKLHRLESEDVFTVAEDTTITVVWSADLCTVTFETYGKLDIESITVPYGEKIPAAPSGEVAGLTFKGWYKDGGQMNRWDFENDVVTGDITLYGGWSPKTNTPYTVKHLLMKDGNLVDKEYAVETLYGTTGTLPTVYAKEIPGYTAREITRKEILGNGSTVISVYYDPNTNTVYKVQHLIVNEAGEEVYETETLTGTTTAMTNAQAITIDGYTARAFEQAAINGDGSTVVKIYYDANTYTVTFDTDGGTAVEPITQAYGTAITAPENPTKDGFHFVKWDTLPETMPAEDLTVKAVWEAHSGGEATCQSGKICETCSTEYTDPDPDAHSYTDGLCDCGAKDPNYVEPSVPSTPIEPSKPNWSSIFNKWFGNWWNKDEQECQHSYKAVVTEPTCTKEGYTTHTCTKCGDSYKDTYVDPLDHTYVGGKCTCGAKDPDYVEPSVPSTPVEPSKPSYSWIFEKIFSWWRK